MTASYATCHKVSVECPVTATTYGYTPSLPGNVIFAAIFGLCILLQLCFGVYFRTWTFLVALVMGCVLEFAGYIGRIQMHFNPWNNGAFETQIICIILGPTFVAAGLYLSLKHIILYLGPEHSRLKPHLYTWIFITCDIGSLLLQAAGGGLASAGSTKTNLLKIGDDVIIAGIAFQVGTMAICGLLGLDFFVRAYKNGAFSSLSALSQEKSTKEWTHFKIFCFAEIVAYFTILVRCIYRIPEMAGGWGNPLMQNEPEFLVLDGAMVAVAVLSLTIFHPGIWFPAMRTGYSNKGR